MLHFAKAIRRMRNRRGLFPRPRHIAIVVRAGVCSHQLNGLAEAVNLSHVEIGRDYRIITVSFDDRDTADIAAKKRSNYVQARHFASPISHGGRCNDPEACRSRGVQIRYERNTRYWHHCFGSNHGICDCTHGERSAYKVEN